MDLLAIADNLATRYAALAAPAGETQAMRGATARPPNAITKPPYVVVTASVDAPAVFTYGSQTRGGVIPFNADFFLEKSANMPRQMVRLERWVPVLLDASLLGIHLGLPLVVAQTWAESFQIGDLLYAGQKWAGVRLVVNVRVSEPIAPTP